MKRQANNEQLDYEELRWANEWMAQKATSDFSYFIPYINPAYRRKWFHRVIAEHCQKLLEGEIQNLMVFVGPQHGKLLADDTLVPTPNGFVRHGDLKPGDYVFDRGGKPVKVLATSPKDRTEYKITFSDGSSFYCHGNHEWVIYCSNMRYYRVYETKRLANLVLEFGTPGKRGHGYIYQADSPIPVEFAARPVHIDPYTLGAWLGDGKSDAPQITIGNHDYEIIENIPYKHTSHWIQEDTGVEYFYFGKQLNIGAYGLVRNKHIPDDYIYNTVEVRKALIAGIIDTDGYVYQKNGRVTISNTNKGIIDKLSLILRSLGEAICVTSYEPKMSTGGINGKKVCYQLCFNPSQPYPTCVPRKKIEILRKTHKRSIVSVEKAEGKTGNCIQVEGGVYLIGESFIPTHNSEIISRSFPAWALGRNPNLKIAGCSYSSDLSQQFSRAIQRIIDSDEYRYIFPDTYLNGQSAQTSVRGYVRNLDLFETVGHKGFYKAVGVCGSLTGTPVDIGIIDDPVKDRLEANSIVYRERVWDWYTSVFLTRLHNESRQLFIMTRWHEDDLAGRILQREPEKWTVLKLPAIRETLNDGNDFDPRKVGEALWPERHSLESLLSQKRNSERNFSALYQQCPTIDGGNIVKREWFGHISRRDFENLVGEKAKRLTFFVDTAYTDRTSNDPTGIIGTCYAGNKLYVSCAKKVMMKFPDLCRFLPAYVKDHGYGYGSSVRIEPKANGLSVIDMLQESTPLNVVATKPPKDSKETRLNAASPYIESGRVVIVIDDWNDAFVEEVCGFPARAHDEYVDLLCYACDWHFTNSRGATDEEILRDFL